MQRRQPTASTENSGLPVALPSKPTQTTGSAPQIPKSGRTRASANSAFSGACTLLFSVGLHPIHSSALAHSLEKEGGIPLSSQIGTRPITVCLLAEEFWGGEPEELTAGWGEALEFEGGYAGFLELGYLML